jgi:polysaccharide export outer membrane protein
MKFCRILLLLAVPVYLISCKTTERIPNYLERSPIDTTGINAVKYRELMIQKNDLLSIQIYSLSTIPRADEIYNQPTSTAITPAPIAGYLVDMNGNIEHSRLGVFHVEGLTKGELAAEIKKRLTVPVELLTSPTVIIRFLNFKVTVLGEVAKQGTITVPGERITILEAIGLAGDFTQYGKKHTVKVTREVNGKREIGTIDLSSTELFDSPYYNLSQNDVIFVEPTKQKLKQADQAIVSQRISIALGVITAAAFIYNVFK